MSPTQLSIIIVNWNGMSFLPNCLKSVVHDPPSISYDLVIIDNDSRDGSKEWLESGELGTIVKGVDYTYIQTGSNLGFGRAVNIGIKNGAAPLLLFLNPDTVVRRGSIDRLAEMLTTAPDAGAVVPKLLNADGTLQPCVWAEPGPFKIFAENGLHRFLPWDLLAETVFGPFWSYDETRPVPIVCAAAMMVKRIVLDGVGTFDEDFHMYGEDFDLALRITQGGWRLYFVHDAEVYHLSGQSSRQRWSNFEKTLMMERGSILFDRKRLPKRHVFANLLSRVAVYGAHVVKNMLRPSERSRYRTLVMLNLRALRELVFHPRDISRLRSLLAEAERPYDAEGGAQHCQSNIEVKSEL